MEAVAGTTAEIDLNQIAREELSNRGFDSNCGWVGSNRMAESTINERT